MYGLLCCNVVTLVKLCAIVGSLVGVVMIAKCLLDFKLSPCSECCMLSSG
jgi:hypothetical protein